MKWKPIFVLVPVLFLGAAVFSTADARPAAANITWPLSLIMQPCVSIGVQGPGSGPAQVVCTGVTGRPATVNVPAPWVSDRSPELSLVSIPTFFNLEWDPQSAGAQDSAPLTLEYPVGDPTDRLVNVRVQLRLRAVEAGGDASESRLLAANVAVETPDSLYLIHPDDTGNEFYQYACGRQSGLPLDLSIPSNPLLSIGPDLGGYEDGCPGIQSALADLGPSFPFGAFTSGAGNSSTFRYMDWPALPMPRFISFSPFASIYGAGADRGSPAFQISATTRFTVEARVVWDEHRHKQEEITTDCDWSYWPDYDFIDWSRWPGPIYCRNQVVVTWPVFCEPFAGSCAGYYGNPDDWWISYVPALEAEAIRRPDGSYGVAYDFVSVQSQSLLTAP